MFNRPTRHDTKMSAMSGRRRFVDERGVEYTFDVDLHCGDQMYDTFCIVGPGHYGKHWNGMRTWHDRANPRERLNQSRGDRDG